LQFIGIIVEKLESVEALNELLSEYGEFIIAGWEFPIRQKR
jgi:hypothetical protein